MDGRLTRTNCDGAGDYVMPNVLSPFDLVSCLKYFLLSFVYS